jgi:hypothetical protein
MIVWKEWRKTMSNSTDAWVYEGWFLFGLIPLYIRRHGTDATHGEHKEK